MADALRPFMVALVLLDVVFVHLTGVVGLPWLVPLYGLTLLAPSLVRCHDLLVYRLGWNGAVLALSGVLLHHALTTGLLHMLEDGMLLAILCQVHLLNNIGSRQKPDLLFFNSFLIAFITSFFCQDAVYSVVFLAYAAVLIPSLQLHVVLRSDAAAPAGLVGRVLRDSVPRTALVLAATTGVFLFWPRDFHRDGWLESRLRSGGSQMMVGFADEVRLDRRGDAVLSNREVMRIRLRQGAPEQMPDRWRGATFIEYRTGGWTAEPTMQSTLAGAIDHPWQPDGETGWRRPAGPPQSLLEVHLLDWSGQRVFLPLCAGQVVWPLQPTGAPGPRPDGTMLHGLPGSPVRSLTYSVTACTAPPPLVVGRTALRRLTAVDETRLPRPLFDLARHLRGRLPADAEPAAMAESFCDWLARNRRYVLPGTRGAARGLVEFVTGSAGGHCEFFATTLALLLRIQAVPCRVVTGYLSGETDPATGERVVRLRHAHAWVEALLPGQGWVTLDATPGDLAGQGADGPSWWESARDQVSAWWGAVTGFDEAGRSRALAWLAALPGRLVAWLHAHPWPALAMLTLLTAWLAVRRRGGDRATLALLRAMRRAGLRRRSGETPRELLLRAQAAALPPARIQALAVAVQAHEVQRYARSGRGAGLTLALLLGCGAALPAQAPPRVIGMTPHHGDASVPPGPRELRVTFDRPMDPGLRLAGRGGALPLLQHSWDPTGMLILRVDLQPDSVCCVELGTGGLGLRDRHGRAVQAPPWRFATAPLLPDSLTVRTDRARESLLRLGLLLRDHYSYRDRLGVDWDDRLAGVADRAAAALSGAALTLLLAETLAVGQDAGIHLVWRGTRVPTFRPAVPVDHRVAVLPGTLPGLVRLNDTTLVGETADGLGYLLVASFAEPHRANVDAAIGELRQRRHLRGLVLDIRPNGGGSEPVARSLAAWFVSGRRVYAAHRPCDPTAAGGVGPRIDRVLAGNQAPDRFDGPVMVLMGPGNLGAAESFLLMMLQSPSATLIGSRSGGCSGNPRLHAIVPGLDIELPSWSALRPDGTCFEGQGIEPHLPVAAAEPDFAEHDPLLQRALDQLRARLRGGGPAAPAAAPAPGRH